MEIRWVAIRQIDNRIDVRRLPFESPPQNQFVLGGRTVDEQPYMPAKISIYRRPLVEDFGDDPARLQEEIRITVLHELAHYFGLDEDRLDELGYA